MLEGFFQGELDGSLDLAVGAETAAHYTNAQVLLEGKSRD